MFELFVLQDFFSTLHTYKSSHKRSFLRLRSFSILGGIIVFQEVVPIGFRTEIVVGYFAHIEMVNGFAKTLFMTKDEIINHAKKYSKSYGYSSSAWQTEFDAMAKKTVIRNLLSHYGYLSVEMVGAIDEDIRADTQYRDQDVREHTGKKTFDVERVEFEEVQGDNGGEDDSGEYHEEPGF